MSVVTEILDRMPNSDGGLRRRFSSGLLFILIIAMGIYWFPRIPILADFITAYIRTADFELSHFNSTGILVAIFSLIFIIGNIIEVFAHVFLNRLFSLFGGLAARHGIKKFYDDIQDQEQSSSFPSATQNFVHERLPKFVRKGLIDPYKHQFDVAFRYLIYSAPDDEKVWLQNLDTRNRNLFSVLCSILTAVVLVLTLSATNRDTILNSKSVDCFTNFFSYARENELIDEFDFNHIMGYIVNRKPIPFSVSDDLSQIWLLDTIEMDGSLTQDQPNASEQTEINLFTSLSDCAGLNSPNVVSIYEIFSSILYFLAVCVGLAVMYAYMLLNTVISALTMLSLRFENKN